MTLPGEILSRKASQIAEIDDQIRDLAASMVELMYNSPGCVGLAANQVGRSESLFVLDVSSHKKTTTGHGLVVMLNPELIHVSDLETMREGCMSVPDLTGDVKRARSIVVRGQDLTGQAAVFETDGFEARAFQHEIDHLNGLLFIDRVDSPSGLHQRRRYL